MNPGCRDCSSPAVAIVHIVPEYDKKEEIQDPYCEHHLGVAESALSNLGRRYTITHLPLSTPEGQTPSAEVK